MLILYVSPILNTVIPYLVFLIKRLKPITCREILLQALISEFLAAFVPKFHTYWGRCKNYTHESSHTRRKNKNSSAPGLTITK